MTNTIDIQYGQTGQSTQVNAFGMREMQERAYNARDAQYLLLNAPPASGKSRALMFVALDKLHYQGIKKVIVAVPERSIGHSFGVTDLTSYGFFTDWQPNPEFNLCTPGANESKVAAFIRFMNSNATILIATHATLRFAFEKIEPSQLNDTFLVIDEFHHVSADKESSRLGQLLHKVMAKTNAHVMAMTGSYFRGDGAPILLPEDEAKFTKVIYNYFEQINGYTYLKTLGISYPFYQGKYTSAIARVLDTDKKTILHIPNVNSGDSTKDKYQEVDTILDIIGRVDHQDPETGIIYLKRHTDGKLLKIANLVEEDRRDNVVDYLRTIRSADDLDLIIALGMAKEGFDWPYCEHALTVGYRGSLTEVVQIIGRCTRDSSNKSHAQFTNLLAQPDATDEQVAVSVNNMLKAIACSLLMEQVMTPKLIFKTKGSEEDTANPNEIVIDGFKEPSSDRTSEILRSDLNDLKAAILQDERMTNALSGHLDPEVINKVIIPNIISNKYPELTTDEIEEVRQHVVADLVIQGSEITTSGDQRFIRLADSFINVEDLNIDLIDQINPFQKVYIILSKTVTADVLSLIQAAIASQRIEMTDDEAILLWPKIKHFVQNNNGKHPSIHSQDPLQKRLAEALSYIKNQRRIKNL